MKKRFLLVLFILILGLCAPSWAMYIEVGDAASQSDADVVVDIVFVADTSGSMYDELRAISNMVYNAIMDIDCPECDAWIRARFMNINGSNYGVFDESVTSYVANVGGTALSNHIEDNGAAVTDMVNYYGWNDNTTADQDYYMAIVTIGDEGTENGAPVLQNDWDSAYQANQAAILNDIMVFSLVGTNTNNCEAVFEAMAVGGTGGGYTFGDTGGKYSLTTAGTLESDIEEIICTAASGGTNAVSADPVPEPASLFLLGSGLLGLCGFIRKKQKKA